jgi:phenylacetate-CoA ligase
LLEVIGRKTDQIVCRSPQGLKHMHALALIYVLREADGLRQFRITQRSLDALEIEIVPGPDFTSSTEHTVLAQLRQRLGSEMDIRILHRERIAPTASGKHACVVSALQPEPHTAPISALLCPGT